MCVCVCHIVCLLLCHIYAHLNRPDRRTGSLFICCVTLTAAQRLSCCPQLIVCLFNECLRSPLAAPCSALSPRWEPSKWLANQLNANINCKLRIAIAIWKSDIRVGGIKTWLSYGVIKMLESQMNLTKAARQLTDGPPPPKPHWDSALLHCKEHTCSGPVQRGEGSWQLAACWQ